MTDISKYVDGFKRFHKSYFGENRVLFSQLKQGQHPCAMVIACSDSRVDPAIIMGCGPGDLFVVRNVANLVPPYETGGGLHGVSAALEFGVCMVGVEHIIVLGHRQCGGVRALMQDAAATAGNSEFIKDWVSIADRAKARVMAEMPEASESDRHSACEQASILVSMENLLTFPWIKSRVQQGRLELHGWYFNIETGVMEIYNPETSQFAPLNLLSMEK